MKNFNLLYAFIILGITNFIVASEKLEICNQRFNTRVEAGKGLDIFLNSKIVKNFTFNENRSVVMIDLIDGSACSIVLMKGPISNEFFFRLKEDAEKMKTRTSFDDLGSGNF